MLDTAIRPDPASPATSGSPAELLRWAGIDRGAIERVVRDLISEEPGT